MTTAQGKLYFHVHELLRRCGKDGDPRKFVHGHTLPSERATNSVGNWRLGASRQPGASRQQASSSCYHLLEFLPGLDDAVALADAPGIALGDEAAALATTLRERTRLACHQRRRSVRCRAGGDLPKEVQEDDAARSRLRSGYDAAGGVDNASTPALPQLVGLGAALRAAPRVGVHQGG